MIWHLSRLVYFLFPLRISSFKHSSSFLSFRTALYSSSSPSMKQPKDIILPMDKIDFSYARSSGPGGQNVNKLNTKAELRFHVMTADWLPIEVRQRLFEYQANKINKNGEIVVTSQESRTQSSNREDCVLKLQTMVLFLSLYSFYDSFIYKMRLI